ncbi:MAG: hypothetical protein IJD02_05190 [Lachnospiraceae bacterium]|nr:hypothetical protein [Lachnospiraceae bacterium]
MFYLYNILTATAAPTATAAAKEIEDITDINPVYLIIAIAAFLTIMISPLIQINLSASKNKYLWVIPPIVSGILFTVIAFLTIENIFGRIFLSISVPIVLVIIHIATKKNLIN